MIGLQMLIGGHHPSPQIKRPLYDLLKYLLAKIGVHIDGCVVANEVRSYMCDATCLLEPLVVSMRGGPTWELEYYSPYHT